MATIWLDIVDMGGFGSKMERDNSQLGGMDFPNTSGKNNKKNNVPVNNGAKSPKISSNSRNVELGNSVNTHPAAANRIPNNNYGPNVESGLPLNTSIIATNGNNNSTSSNNNTKPRSRRPSNANSVNAEVTSIEVEPPESQTGGKRYKKSRKNRRKNRKSRKNSRRN